MLTKIAQVPVVYTKPFSIKPELCDKPLMCYVYVDNEHRVHEFFDLNELAEAVNLKHIAFTKNPYFMSMGRFYASPMSIVKDCFYKLDILDTWDVFDTKPIPLTEGLQRLCFELLEASAKIHWKAQADYSFKYASHLSKDDYQDCFE